MHYTPLTGTVTIIQKNNKVLNHDALHAPCGDCSSIILLFVVPLQMHYAPLAGTVTYYSRINTKKF